MPSSARRDLRSTSSDWYSRPMGTQGLRNRVTDPRGGARDSLGRLVLIVTSFAVLPALAGCSSFSSSSSPAAQTATVSPPPNVAMVAPAAPPPPADSGADLYPYPKQSLAELFTDSNSPPRAQSVPRPPSTYTPSGQPYAANAPVYDPAPGVAPAPPPAPPPNAGPASSVYPQQSLFDIFSSK
jgi:hypothetical protein